MVDGGDKSMTTQKQIKEWIPAAVETFQRFMPCPQIPEIHILSENTLFKKRAAIVERIQSKQKNAPPEGYSAIMEMIHGDMGDAILIRQKYITSPERSRRAEEEFSHYLWHELGHYVAITSDNDNLVRFMDQSRQVDFSDPPEFAKREGYWFWSEFIAESIANHVSMRVNQAKEDYHPEEIIVEPNKWCRINQQLHYLLDNTLNYFPTTIDEASLGNYFALLLKDDMAVHYRRAAAAGVLKKYSLRSAHFTQRLLPGSIDPTGISDLPETHQETLKCMMRKLEKQLEKEEFWILPKDCEDWLEDIGQMIVDLQTNKLGLIAANTPRETLLESLRNQLGNEKFEAVMRSLQ